MMSALLPPGPRGRPELLCADDDAAMAADARNVLSQAALYSRFTARADSLASSVIPAGVFAHDQDGTPVEAHVAACLVIVVGIQNIYHHRRRRQDALGRMPRIEFETLT